MLCKAHKVRTTPAPAANFLKGRMIAARIVSIKVLSTPRGQRLYVVFKTSKTPKALGLWLTPGRSSIQAIQVGDRVLLQQSDEGHLRLALRPLPQITQLKLFSWLNRWIELFNR